MQHERRWQVAWLESWNVIRHTVHHAQVFLGESGRPHCVVHAQLLFVQLQRPQLRLLVPDVDSLLRTVVEVSSLTLRFLASRGLYALVEFQRWHEVFGARLGLLLSRLLDIIAPAWVIVASWVLPPPFRRG